MFTVSYAEYVELRTFCCPFKLQMGNLIDKVKGYSVAPKHLKAKNIRILKTHFLWILNL